MRKTFIYFLLTFIYLSLGKSNAQSMKDLAAEAVTFNCSCTEKVLTAHGVDIKKLEKVVNAYNTMNATQFKLTNMKDVDILWAQLQKSEDAVTPELYSCRQKFQNKYRAYLHNETFKKFLSPNMQNCVSITAPALIEKIKGK
jgi:hypothetical protein